MPSSRHVDVIIVNYRASADTLVAVQSLMPWRFGTLWLVDNSEDPAEAEMLARHVYATVPDGSASYIGGDSDSDVPGRSALVESDISSRTPFLPRASMRASRALRSRSSPTRWCRVDG